jgi:regulator of nucleoside diphosphate kinase
MSKASVLFGRGERERLRRYVTAWNNKLALDAQHIAAIRARLESASVASTDQLPADVVTLDSQVCVRDLTSGRTFVWTVILPADEDVENSARSPLSWSGATLLGRREGDEFEWLTRAGSRRVRIESVMFQPKVAGGARRKVRNARRRVVQHRGGRNAHKRSDLRQR